MKLLVSSLGCDKNRVDAERMLGLLRARGYSFTDDEAEADAAIVNTCCFIHDAKTESIREILHLADLKQTGQLKALVVAGCLAERYKEEIREEIPEVDAIVGTGAVDRIADALSSALKGATRDFFEDIDRTYKHAAGRVLTTGGYYAYLKIAEGCDKNCTYCIIPSLRGRYRSEPEEDVVAEARALAREGARELILVAQETTRYGVDLYGEKRLPRLLERLCKETDGVAWIRLLYCYPEEIDDALIDVMRREKKIVPYLDIPVQSGSDAILKRMGRKTSNAEIRALVKKLRTRIPDVCLRTTLITGFPGETAADHRASMELVRDLRFDRLGVFTYSREEGTSADRMRAQIAEPLKKRRRTQLMKLQQAIAFEKAAAQKGKTVEVLIEGELADEEDGETVYVGRTKRDAPDVDGYLFFTSARKTHMSGDLARVRVTGAKDYDLIGEEI